MHAWSSYLFILHVKRRLNLQIWLFENNGPTWRAGHQFSHAYSPKTGSSRSFGNMSFYLFFHEFLSCSVFKSSWVDHHLHDGHVQLQFLEHKHCLSASHSSSSACKTMEPVPEEDQCKTLSSAIEEAHQKGTLMERVAVLENRVLQVSSNGNSFVSWPLLAYLCLH